MAVGDLVNLKRTRFQTNERLDLVDSLPLTQTPSDLLAIVMKALLGKPPAAPGAVFPSGCGWQVLKPVITGGPGSFQLSVGAGAVVSVDADGQLIIKESGIAQTISGFAVGVQYLYIYRTEVNSNTETRRFIPASGPFNEFSNAMDTKFKGTFGFYVAPVGNPLVVEAAVGTQQVILCSIGRATFDGGGAMTNFEFTDNFIQNSVDPATFVFPANATTPGGVSDELVQSKAILGLLSRLNWGGSPDAHMGGAARSRANNFNAWKTPGAFRPGAPQIGLEETNRRTPGTITVGDGVNTFGQIDKTDFASTQALFQFMFENFGVYELKPGSVFQFTGNCVPTTGGSTLPHTTIYMNKSTLDFNNFTLNMEFCSGSTFRDGRFIDSSGLSGGIYFPDEVITHVKFQHCLFFSNDAPAVFGDVTGVNTLNAIEIDNCEFLVSVSVTSDVAGCIDLTAVDEFKLRNCKFTTGTLNNTVRRLVTLNKVKHDLLVEGNMFEQNGDDTGVGPTTSPRLLEVGSDNGATYRQRVIRGNQFNGVPKAAAANNTSRSIALGLTDIADVVVESNTFSRVRAAIGHLFVTAGFPARLNITYRDNTITNVSSTAIAVNLGSALSGTFDGVFIYDNTLIDVKLNSAIAVLGNAAGNSLRNLKITGNVFQNISVDTIAAFAARDGKAIHIHTLNTLQETVISGNSFLNCANTPVLVTGLTTVDTLHVHGNTFNNILTPEQLGNATHTMNAEVLCAYGVLITTAGSGAIFNVKITENEFQNVFTYNTTTFGRPCLAVMAGVSVVGIHVADNVVGNLASGYSGGTMSAGYLVAVDGSGGNVNTIMVQRNTVSGLGNTSTRLANILATNNIIVVDISNNTIVVNFDTGLQIGVSVTTSMVSLNGATAINISMNDNKIHGFSGGTAAWPCHMFESNMTGGNNGLTIQGNLFFASHGWAIVATKGFGVHLNGRSVFNYSVQNNSATRLSYGGSDNAPLFYGPFSPTIPAPAVEGNGGSTITSHYVGYNEASQNADGSVGGGPARNRGWSRI